MFEHRDDRAILGPMPSPSPSRGAGGERDAKFLFENILCDVHWSALHIATLTILLNALIKSNPRWTLRAWRHISGENSSIMRLALRYCPEIGLSGEIGRRISDLYGDLAAAKTLIAPVMKGASAYSASERQLLTRAAPKWRQLCHDATRVLSDLEPDAKLRLRGVYVEDTRTLTQFLA
jgi:hypothetical protein